jgi:hypothetical protein
MTSSGDVSVCTSSPGRCATVRVNGRGGRFACVRRILTEVIAGQVELLADLQAVSPGPSLTPPS